jgi:DNA polymerase III subunit epsilon
LIVLESGIMRLLVLDTETTGLKVEEGHRLIEIGCVEVTNRQVSETHFHYLLNPDREIDEGATAVHGFTWDRLKTEPRFADVVEPFLSFIQNATLVIHNAPFDTGFIDAELKRVGRPPLAQHAHQVIDSLAMARERHPGQRNSLDALCQRYGVSNEHRVLHGALLDAQLLADVYLAMTRGQESLRISDEDHPSEQAMSLKDLGLHDLVVRRANDQELAAHDQFLTGMLKHKR